jgi:hypothetical protein
MKKNNSMLNTRSEEEGVSRSTQKKKERKKKTQLGSKPTIVLEGIPYNGVENWLKLVERSKTEKTVEVFFVIVSCFECRCFCLVALVSNDDKCFGW